MRKGNKKRLLTGLLCMVLVLANITSTGISATEAELNAVSEVAENQDEEKTWNMDLQSTFSVKGRNSVGNCKGERQF